jgi:hypothetical protein
VPVNNRIYLVDRQDQVLWYLDAQGPKHQIVVRDNHREIREWLETMTQGVVVISGQGVMPRLGSTDHPSNVYDMMNRKVYMVHFDNLQDSMAFKLAWGGDQ